MRRGGLKGGKARAKKLSATVRDLESEGVQCDEIWSFVGMKEKTAKAMSWDRPKNVGGVRTWTRSTRTASSSFRGSSAAVTGYAYAFMRNVAKRLTRRVQLAIDRHRAYLSAVEDTFGRDVDYAQLVKVYGPDPKEDERRYSPAQCLGTEKNARIGNPADEHIRRRSSSGAISRCA